jgi:hypothetical protein
VSWNSPVTGRSPEALAFGLALIALGSVWLAADFGYVELVPTLRRWWPLTLVVWGSLELWSSLKARAARR